MFVCKVGDVFLFKYLVNEEVWIYKYFELKRENYLFEVKDVV